ncbi:DEAD/DEAH box helicase [Saccharothrix australiensis]|uniref:UvrD-like helicase family protein n=1 Tax=Saccharothrix australiensis TaxID=2072 RepID=A0A495W0A9_9PSEU|nr:ATP-binding protein [Saccharothrix australiensis]RKT54437.1 UvrD-like helicase family protein [Saccharothrix australiensis]
MHSDAKRARVVEYWRTVEMFSPQKVDKVDRERMVYAVRPDQPLPWEPGHVLARRRLTAKQTWRHVVHLGIYQLDGVYEALSRVFTPDEESYDDRPAGESAVAAFVVDERGQAVLDSIVLSGCAWATGQVVRHGGGRVDWLSGFDKAANGFSEEWRDIVAVEDVGSGEGVPITRTPRSLDHGDLADCLAAAVAATGTGVILRPGEIRVRSQVVSRRTAASAGHDFLNSFIVDDLGNVAERLASGDFGAALREYLSPEGSISTARRVDVRENVHAVLEATAPDRVPSGRWPSDPEHPLALNQQLAVNTALSMSDAGVVGVNGPPGTGKTTMLRDLIAALVVERARRLSVLSDPRKAFTSRKMRWKSGQRTRVVSEWRPDLVGFEVVVASSNNGAVQNVTDEIPAADAIDGSWRAQAAAVDYFAEIAGNLLTTDDEPEADDDQEGSPAPAWALIAARLGNKANRSRFVNAFWYETRKDDDPKSWDGLLAILRTYENSAPETGWRSAVEEFRAAEALVSTLRARRDEVYQAVRRHQRLTDEVAALRRSVAEAQEVLDSAHHRHTTALAEEERGNDAFTAVQAAHRAEVERITREHRTSVEQAVEAWKSLVDTRWQAHLMHQQQRPSTWSSLRTFGRSYRRWKRHDAALLEQVQQAQAGLALAHQAPLPAMPTAPGTPASLTWARNVVAAARHAVDEARRAVERAASALRDREAELDSARRTREAGAEELKKHFPDDEWYHDRERRESAALWTDPEWNAARSALLLAALALHKAFLRHVPGEMRRNLQAAMDLVSGEAPSDVAQDAALEAWRSLFFVVPVVSTTFASYARLFGHLGRAALGWLLVDEAGQATPQNAVGALWRTRRAVVVGDPLQLEPVTTLPFRAEQAIRTQLGVDEEWSASRTSVQRLADRLTPLGTSLPDGDGLAWVGVPLTVHRRCDQPMFDIVNDIAYDGLMINGTGPAAGERFARAFPSLPPSKWIDVVSGTSQGHWVPEEGERLDRVLAALADLGFDMSEVMVVAPFRDVARRLASRSHRYPGLVAGTVHTAQGKQADVVVLVLGSDPARPGARRWAAGKPNLLNVAVSRAKRRLYVIGNRSSWSAQRYFDVLSAHLPD